MKSQTFIRAAVWAASVAIFLAGWGWFTIRPVAGRESKEQTLYGAAALDQLKQDGQYDSLSDPIFSLQQKLLAADGESQDRFGSVIALDGDTAVVGAYWDDIGANGNQGSVYVFTRSGATWTLQQKLVADDGAAYEFFGSAVAIEGDTLVVGSLWDDIGANTNQGSVYVFTRSGTIWTQQQKLIADDGAGWDLFGSAVALNGDTLVVGAPEDDIGANANQGSAYVFTRSGATWIQQQKLIAGDGATNDVFGAAVALDGDTLVAGAYRDNIDPTPAQGSAYVFTRGGATWAQQQKLTASDGGSFASFGYAVAIEGATLVVGAPSADIGATINPGSVYVFTRGGATWTLQQKLIADDGAGWDYFGYAVALDGDTLVAGAYRDSIGANANQGSAYVFKRGGATWIQQQKLIAGDGAAYDEFGCAVALDGGALVVGAGYDSIGSIAYQGSVYVFSLPITSCPSVTIEPYSLPDGEVGEAYSQALTATGGSAPYTFGPLGDLPPGLSLSANGVLSGAPTLDGNYNFRVVVEDANGCVSRSDISITIEK